MLSRGIQSAIVVQQTQRQPQNDLAHTLRRWKQAGMDIRTKSLDADGPPVSCTVYKPTAFGSIWHKLLATMGLRANPLGGYGATLPEPSSG